ncbi:BlaI/MecI/CopY family transcriptional regulator, partial [Streptomyces parvulus]
RDGEPAPSAGSAEPRVSARESAPAPSSPADADTRDAAHEATPTAAHHAPHPAARDAAHDEGH